MRIFLGTGLGPGLSRPGGPGPEGGAGPRMLRAPRIAGAEAGEGRIGARLALDPGEWRGAERLVYAWLRDGEPIAEAGGMLAYAPVTADDRALLAAEVTAHGAEGATAQARTAPITIAFPPPVAVAPEREFAYTQITGTVTLDISSFFSGSSLSFGVLGEGLTIDPQTGFVTFGAGSLASGVTFRLIARNSGGEARVDFTLRHTPQVALPAATVAPRLSGTGRVGEPLVADPGAWTGATAIALQWLKDGAAIEGATGVEFIPGDSEDGARIACRATASNAAGSTTAETAAILVVQAPPALAGALADQILPVAAGAIGIPTAGVFSGRGLRFAVAGAGATIDAAGVVSIPTATARAAEQVTVTATNSGGSAEARFSVRILAAPTALAAPAASVLAQGTGTATVEAAGWFSGEALAFALEGGPAGAAIAATGRVTLPLAAAWAGEVTVRATNVAGAAIQRLSLRILAAPTALAAPAASVLAQGTGTATVEAAGWFSGEALAFALEGGPAGAAIAATGRVTLPLAAAWAGEVTVRATNVAGAAIQRLSLRILAAPTALAAPAASVLAQGTGTATVEAAGWFSGEALAFALEGGPAGAAIAATGRVTLPLAAAWAGEVTVRATNVAGAAIQRLSLRILAAPTALAAPAPVTFLQGTGVATVSTQAFFSGPDLAFALEGAPAGITIQPGSGLVSLATDAPRTTELVIRATNPAGSATQRLSLTVAATVSDFSTAAEVARMSFLYQSEAPSWTAGAGFGRLRSAAADRAHGDWPLARGDGRYRALARWSMDGQTMTQARPFGLSGRVSKTGSDFLGLQVYALLTTAGARQIQMRVYSGASVGTSIISTAASAWNWDVWNWFEVEFEAGRIRARIYAETEAQPTTWQATAATTHLAPGAFGPMSQGLNGLAPLADIRRLEYQPLASAAGAAPAAAQDADWSLSQTKVQQ